MNIGCAVRYLDYLDEEQWLAPMRDYDFWTTSPAYGVQYDDSHVSLAYFILAANGSYGMPPGYGGGKESFDHVACPPEFLQDRRINTLVNDWATMHARLYGPGKVTKMGLYSFGPRGRLGYHVDGMVRLEGGKYDLSSPDEWREAVDSQSSHRTVMPLTLGRGAKFLITGKQIRMTPGLLFEFSNTVPHAFANDCDEHAVMLVTTYQANAEVFR